MTAQIFSVFPLLRRPETVILLTLLLFIHSCRNADNSVKISPMRLDGKGIMEEWLVTGPITIASLSGQTSDEIAAATLQKDYLTSLGGDRASQN